MTFEKEPLTVGGQRVGTIATHTRLSAEQGAA
jgi:hypothetical protein